MRVRIHGRSRTPIAQVLQTATAQLDIADAAQAPTI